MASNELLLTIAIPTYNRSEYLDKTIASIVCDPLFSNGQVDLVISDNCSTDNTGEIVTKYQEQYNNIRYHRNDENIRDANFITVLGLGQGVFLKMYNDTAIFLDGTIVFLLKTIQLNIEKKPVLCFPNGDIPWASFEEKPCSSFEAFVGAMTYLSTWIGAFGIWKTDFEQLTNIDKSVALQLWQTDILFRLVSQKQSAIIYNNKLVQIQALTRKGGYNLFKVFADNYLSLYKEYVDSKQLSKCGFKKEKKRLLRFFFGWIQTLWIKNDGTYEFEIKDGLKILLKHYKTYPLFYAGVGYLALKKCCFSTKKVLS